MPLEHGYREIYTLTMNPRAQRGKAGWTQLQTAAGNRNWLLTVFTSIHKRVFLQGINIFPSHNLVEIKFGTWYISLFLKSGKIHHNLQEL